MGKNTIKKLAAVLLASTVLIAFISCKEIGLRGYIIDKVVGLEEVELDSPTVNNATPVVSWEEIQDAAGYRYQWDAIEAAGWTETSDTSFVQEQELPDGEHTLYLQVKNAAGLWSPIYSFLFTIDHTLTAPPSVTGPVTTTSLRPTWTWSAVDGAVQYSYQLDANGEDGYTAASALSYTPEADLAIGEHRLYVRAQNAEGKWSGWGYHAVTITEPETDGEEDPPDTADTTAPTVEDHTPGTADSVAGVNIVTTFSEAMDTVSAEEAFSLKEGAAPGTTDVPGSFSWSGSNTIMIFNPSGDLTAGTYTYSLAATAKDAAGNALTAGISNTEFEVVAIFSDSGNPYEIDSVSNQKLLSFIWNSTDNQYACLYNSTDGLSLKTFNDPSFPGTAQTGFGISNVDTGSADIKWNGTSYGIVAADTTSGSRAVKYYEVDSSGSITAGPVSIYFIYDAHTQVDIKYLNSVSLAWDPINSKWGIAWGQDSDLSDSSITYDVCFATIDADGTSLSTPVNITSATAQYFEPEINWVGSQFGIVMTNASSPYDGSFIEVPAGDDGSNAGTITQITSDKTYYGMTGYWNGSELGVAWLDWNESENFMFQAIDSNGNTLGSPVTLVDNSGTDNGYAGTDNMDVSWNGSAFGIVWSTGNSNEVEFCTVAGSGSSWSLDTAPLIISLDDGANSRNPLLIWNESRWCSEYNKQDDSRVQFIY